MSGKYGKTKIFPLGLTNEKKSWHGNNFDIFPAAKSKQIDQCNIEDDSSIPKLDQGAER